MKRWIVLTVITGSLALGALALARPGPGGPGGPAGHGRGGMDHGFGRLLENPEIVGNLGLTSSNVEALKTLRYEAAKKRISLKAEVEEARLELRHLLHSDEPDESAVMKAIEEVGEATVELRKSDVKHMLKARSIVGTDKWKKMSEMGRQMRHRMHERRGRSHDRGDRRHDGERGHRGRRGPAGHGPPPERD